MRGSFLPVLALLFIAAAPAAAEEKWEPPVHDRPVVVTLLADLAEYGRTADGGENVRWDIVGWIGGDYHRIWLKSEGEHDFGAGSSGEVDAQVLYGRLIAPYWDLQIGVRQEWRYDSRRDRTRTSAVIGVQGIAPYWFELEPSLFISEDGDVSARITAEYDLFLTQRLILQPRVETELAVQEVKGWGIGRGVKDIEAGLRLRYEIHRKFAPYIGLTWRRDVGETAALTRDEGKEVEERALVVGVRMWF